MDDIINSLTLGSLHLAQSQAKSWESQLSAIPTSNHDLCLVHLCFILLSFLNFDSTNTALAIRRAYKILSVSNSETDQILSTLISLYQDIKSGNVPLFLYRIQSMDAGGSFQDLNRMIPFVVQHVTSTYMDRLTQCCKSVLTSSPLIHHYSDELAHPVFHDELIRRGWTLDQSSGLYTNNNSGVSPPPACCSSDTTSPQFMSSNMIMDQLNVLINQVRQQ